MQPQTLTLYGEKALHRSERAVEEDRRQPLRKDAKKMGVSHTVVAAHLELLGIVKKLDKWVPHDFTEQQQLKRFEVQVRC
uniref:Transcriptional regulator n=1 Tax=Haemonchus contortus TaxID=6289 RepID=A0A7I4YHZ3_HAECO